MPGLQREIVDERGYRLGDTPFQSEVGSLGGFGLRNVLTGVEPGWGSGDFVPFPIDFAGHRDTHFVVSDVSGLFKTGNVRTEPRSRAAGLRERELEWRRTHAEVLKTYINQWVVLEGEEIVSHGSDPGQVVAEARARGIQTPYVFYVEFTVGLAFLGL